MSQTVALPTADFDATDTQAVIEVRQTGMTPVFIGLLVLTVLGNLVLVGPSWLAIALP